MNQFRRGIPVVPEPSCHNSVGRFYAGGLLVEDSTLQYNAEEPMVSSLLYYVKGMCCSL